MTDAGAYKLRRRRRRLMTGALVPGLLLVVACQPTPPTTPTKPTTPTTTATTRPVTTTTRPVTTTTRPVTTTTRPVTTTTRPVTTTTTAPVVVQGQPGAEGWTVIGGDEFDGSTLKTDRWRAYHNTYGDGNNELACLRPGNVGLSGGTLKITARKETVTCPVNSTTEHHTSGFLGSRETGTWYPIEARYEIRAKLPHAQGLWPAFWLRHRTGSANAEVDVMEYFHAASPGVSSQTLHLNGKTNVSKRATPFEPPTLQPGWHTWAVEMAFVDQDRDGIEDDVQFEFFVDGTPVHSYVDTVHAWVGTAPADASFDIAINLAVGGRWTGEPDGQLGHLPDLSRCAQPGTFPNCPTAGIRRVDWNNPATSTYEVDWVRVSVPTKPPA